MANVSSIRLYDDNNQAVEYYIKDSVARMLFSGGGQIFQSANLNNYSSVGVYYTTASKGQTLSGLPSFTGYGIASTYDVRFIVTDDSATVKRQTLFVVGVSETYWVRTGTVSGSSVTWGSWSAVCEKDRTAVNGVTYDTTSSPVLKQTINGTDSTIETPDTTPTTGSKHLITSDAVYSAMTTWESYNCLDTSNSGVTTYLNTDSSSCTVKVNRFLKRVVISASLKFKAAYGTGHEFAFCKMSSISGAASLVPLVNARTFMLSTAGYTIAMGKASNTMLATIWMVTGTVPANTTIPLILEYQYF